MRPDPDTPVMDAQRRIDEPYRADADAIRDRIEWTRARMDRTMDEFVDRLRPRTLAHELAEIANFDSATGARLRSKLGEAGSRFLDQVARNPMPVALIAASMIWLGSRSGQDATEADDGSERLDAMRSKVSGAIGGARDKLSRAGSGAHSRLSSARGQASQTLHDAPLAVGIGAAALGVLCGFVLPRTAAEERAAASTLSPGSDGESPPAA